MNSESDIFRPDCMAGKHVLIAGGSTGINFAIGHRFAELGAHLTLLSRNQERIGEAAAKIDPSGASAIGIAADVRDYDAVVRAFEESVAKLGPVDVVISGAAGNFLAPALALSSNAFRTVVEIDLIGTFNVFRSCYDYLRRPGASLIAITSGQARAPFMFQAHANAAKAGVDALTRSLAMEWGPAGIRVNGIAPGPISDTEGMARLAPTEEATAGIKARIPLRDFGSKRDIADMAVYLASPNAAYVTGTILDCDGGSILGDTSADALTIQPRARR